jgi:cbb3-type cytochrome oxidase subunit 3
MFKQITELNGDESYLIFSLFMFLAFFILVGIMLVRMNKDYADEMSQMPLEETDDDGHSILSDNQ